MPYGLETRVPLLSYNFMVVIQMMEMGFSKISNIEYEVETEMVSEGGLNDHAHVLLKAATKEKVMVLERGVATNFIKDVLIENMLNGRFAVGSRLNTDVMIFVLDRNHAPKKVYTLGGCMIKKWKTSDLDSMSNQVLIESFEISYDTLEVTNLKLLAQVAGAGAAAVGLI